MYDRVIAAETKWKASVVTANTNYDNAPACVRALMSNDVPLLNAHKLQLAAVLARAAANWGVPVKTLAQPFIMRIKMSSVNKHRLADVLKDINHQSKQPRDPRLCKTRRGPYSAQRELTCPFRNGRGNHIKACLATRTDGDKLDPDTLTVSTVWTHSSGTV